ncbi:DinB family protein [Halomonas rhizosphaerae]|uniref:DinB family protein n=1 Tax=Halomonas rhizosphaerae TaxID=3043296 RepID=A0ABT6UYI6_9GAMM|nr:DinB family protein [Halomonas rhizosphaerae]MDI5890991.1 DinB family protein [Halomonas rhizosphaerae]
MTSRHSRSSPATARLVEENLLTLAQLRGMVAALTPERYREAFGEHGRHTLGKHVRHIIDHYDALLDGLDRGAEVIDYEQRQRDEALEQWPQQAARHLAAVEARLSLLGSGPSPDALTLAYPLDDERLSLASSLNRELAFLTSHSIHHMAIIALLAEQSGIHLPESFGVHPSTLRHWQRASEEQAPLSRRSA